MQPDRKWHKKCTVERVALPDGSPVMKRNLTLLVLLFAVSAGIFVWLLRATVAAVPKNRKAAWKELIADLDACGRRKHVKAMQYDHFADIAAAEKRHHAERLFRAMAFSEKLQEQNCAVAIRRLGGSYAPPRQVRLFGGPTESNLARSIDAERRSFGQRQVSQIRHAMERGNRYAARILIWASAADRQNIVLMECGDKSEEGRFAVCPVCGNLYAAESLDPFCPFCLTDGAEFVRFE